MIVLNFIVIHTLIEIRLIATDIMIIEIKIR